MERLRPSPPPGRCSPVIAYIPSIPSISGMAHPPPSSSCPPLPHPASPVFSSRFWSVNRRRLLYTSERFIARWVSTQWSECEWWQWIDSDSRHSLVRSLSACQALLLCVTACKQLSSVSDPALLHSSPLFSTLPVSLCFLSFCCSFAVPW